MDLNVLVIGGRIHAVGLLPDLATRKIEGIHLVEQARLASGTSSRTTKLVHGGLRYLERPAQWALVREALRERAFLLRNLPGLVSPLRFDQSGWSRRWGQAFSIMMPRCSTTSLCAWLYRPPFAWVPPMRNKRA